MTCRGLPDHAAQGESCGLDRVEMVERRFVPQYPRQFRGPRGFPRYRPRWLRRRTDRYGMVRARELHPGPLLVGACGVTSASIDTIRKGECGMNKKQGPL